VDLLDHMIRPNKEVTPDRASSEIRHILEGGRFMDLREFILLEKEGTQEDQSRSGLGSRDVPYAKLNEERGTALLFEKLRGTLLPFFPASVRRHPG